jgi:hypothetical protein
MTRVLIPRSDNRNAKKIQTSDFEKYFDFVGDHIASGFCMSAGTGLAVNVSAGTGRLNGLYVEGTTTDEVTDLLPCDGNYVYVTMCNDPNGEPQAWKFTSNITGVTPACSTPLGIATTNCSGVTAVDNITGRRTTSGLGGPQYNQFCSTGTFTPSKQTGFTTVTVDTSCTTAGTIDVKIDGSTTASYESGVNTSIINPSCSLTICANDKGHDLSVASYDSKNKTFCGYFRGMYFRSDGAKYYLAGYTGLREIDMSTPWDVTTASDNDTWTGVRPTIEFGTTVFFKPDGTKAWVSGTPPSGTCYSIREVEFTTAWDVTTASYSGTTFQPAAYVTESVYFKSDGTKGYALTGNDCVNEFSMSTPWDISTASVVNTYCTSAQDGSPKGIDFNDTGTYYYISGDSNNKIFEYSMSTPWDISTSSYTGNSFSVSSQTTAPSSVRFGNSGAKMYIMKQDQRVYQYSTVTAFAGTARASVI